ncbi:MAG: SET domain-containing protein-lysine N-methyltransferase [Patescibacteria group bacterium]|nr:SET domain-containing protein-lysine N-methyltransferase [Patescibacteria group bacterium]
MIKTKILQSPIEGKGYFADENVPKGTIVYFYGEDDVRYSKEDLEKLNKKEKDRLLEDAVEDEFGIWVETSTGLYTNHSCDPNIMPLFIGSQYTSIVVKDIESGDEITVDYSQFFSSTKWEMKCKCGTKQCRKTIGFGLKPDLELEKFWESRINSALECFPKVSQPIFQSEDKYAIKITRFLKSLNKPALGKYVKFSLIDSDESS